MGAYPAYKKDYDAMVFIDGTDVVAIDSDGSVISHGTAGTDDATVIQAAIDYLSGSSYMKRIHITGNYNLESTVNLYGNIEYNFTGKNFLKNSVNNTAFLANSQQNIIFVGGELDGNKSNNTAGHGLIFMNCTSVIVRDVIIHDAFTYGIALVNSSNQVLIDGVTVYSCGANNFHIGPETVGTPLNNYKITNCVSYSSAADGFEFVGVSAQIINCIANNNGGAGFSFDVGSVRCHALNCKAYENGDSGFAVPGSGALKNTFESCDSYTNGAHGIQVSYGGADIIGGSYFNNDYRGISLNCTNNTIIGTRVYNNSQIAANVHQGINISSSDNTTISMCHVYDDQGSPTQKYGISNYSLGVLINNNRLWGNATSQIYDSTITTIYKDNIGYVNISELRDTLNNVLELLGDVRLLLPQAEITGTSITDYTRRANTTTASTSVATWYGYQGRATYYDFNGTAHYLYRANDTDFDFGDAATDDAFSVVCCVNPDDVTSRQIIGKWDDNNQREWRLFFDAAGYPTFQLYDESADTYIGRQDQTAFTTGSWQVLVATYDGSGINAGCKIYIDGVQLDDADYDNGVYVAMEAVTANLMVGALKNAAAYSEYYDGKMTWIGIAAKELSPDEVWSLTQRLKGVLGI